MTDKEKDEVEPKSEASDTGMQVPDLFVDDDQELGEPEPPKIQPKDREETRRTLALILVWTFAGVIAAALGAAIFGPWVPGFSPELLTETVKAVIPPTIALVGTVTGFYYGSERK